MLIAKAACLGKMVIPMTVLPQATQIVPNESYHNF